MSDPKTTSEQWLVRSRTSSSREDIECLPPDGTEDKTIHWLSREVGEGMDRLEFTALWGEGLWHVRGIQALSPSQSGWLSWRYERPFPEYLYKRDAWLAQQRKAKEQQR